MSDVLTPDLAALGYEQHRGCLVLLTLDGATVHALDGRHIGDFREPRIGSVASAYEWPLDSADAALAVAAVEAALLLRAALAVTPATLLAAREIEEAIDHAELAISDLDDGGTVEDVDDEDDGPRPCADCGGFGHGPDTMQGGEHDNGPCPTCNGSGLATPFEDCGAPNRVTGRESAAQEAWDRQAELLDGADLPDLDTDGGGR